ncbi:MAG: hypothetical protein KatS3mg076_1399 [Candidatus Binatia bacterium]|nr:MAG: hypothetical protein KatS3mg076_1399 [Candidatus Binatia bacterium]
MARTVNPLEATLRRVLDDLPRSGRRWALVGGLAVSARAEPRLTRDVDLAVEVSNDADAEQLVLGLQREGYRVVAAVEHETAGRLATVRMRPPGARHTGVVVDLLFASSGIEPEIVRTAEEVEVLPGLRARVARLGYLIALKLLARDDRSRPQDWDDLCALLRQAGRRDIAEARRALWLITERGYHRGRPLAQQLEEILGAVKGR